MQRLSVSGNLCKLLLRLTMLGLPVGEQMLDALVRAIALLGFAVAIAKLSPRSLIIKSCKVQHYLWTYWGI